jgi:adhesin transport system membrane fusion protein
MSENKTATRKKADGGEAWSRAELREIADGIPIGPGTRVAAEDVDFVQDCRVLLRGRRGWGHLLPWIVVLFVGLLLWGASVAELEEVTRGTGKVIPSSSVQLIQSLEGGIMDEILVEEGEQVATGQVLLKVQDEIFSSTYQENLTRRDTLAARLVRLKAEAEGKDELVFPDDIRPELAEKERTLFDIRRWDFQETRKALEERLALITQETSLLSEGRKSRAVSPVELIRAQKEKAEIEGQIRTLESGKTREAMEQYDMDRAELEVVIQAIKRDKDRLDRTVIYSPVEGTVNKIYINTVGRVIGSGVDIMEIVPRDDTLLVEASVRPADIAFLRPGQKATVKFTAYDFTVYGGLEGRVEQIGVDTISNEEGESFYQIKVRTEENSLGQNRAGEELSIIPGMVAEVDILTGKKTILTYLLKPLLRAKERALREK